MGDKNQSNIYFISAFPRMVETFPEPEPSSKNTPQWFRNMPSYAGNDPTPENGVQKITVKKCPAILDVISSGYVLKCPYDLYIDTTEGNLKFDIPAQYASIKTTTLMGSHNREQFSLMPMDDSYVKDLLRLHLVWMVKTDPGYSTSFMSIPYSDSPVVAIPGIVDSDKFYVDGLFSFYVKKNYKGFIKKGTPLVQVVPFKRINYKSNIVKDQKELDKVNKQRSLIRSVFNSAYRKLHWSKKIYN